MTQYKVEDPVKLLILEDISEDVELIIDEFNNSKMPVDYDVATNRKEFYDLIGSNSYDLYLVDYTLYDIDGLEAMDYIRERDPFAPVIFVTGTLGVEKAVNVMQQGANDFVLKKNLYDLPKSAYKALRDTFELRERERINNALKESEKRFRTIADSAPVLMLMIDENRRPEFFNKQWEDFTGYKSVELTHNWLDLVHPDDQDQINHNLNEAYKNKKPFFIEFRLRKHSGSYRWMLNWYNPRFEGKKLQGFSSALIDITDHKTLEKQKNDFLSIASHELKTPLSTLKAYIELIKEAVHEDDDELNLYASKAETSTDKLHKLIHELLDLSRFENGKLNLKSDKIEIDSFIKEIADEFESMSKSHKIILEGETNCQVRGDHEKLEQVFGNILSNAIKYSPDSDKILISLSNSGSSVNIAIRDYGIGIDEKYHDRIFTRFFRVNSDTHLFSGLGIGLFISKNIIDMHGGTITLKSVPDEGSEFIVTLPVA